MITPGSPKTPLTRLRNQGFQPSVRRAIPFVSLYREATAEEAQGALVSGQDMVKIQKDGQTLTLASPESADVLATSVETSPSLDLGGLAKMKAKDQENVLTGLRYHSAESRAENLQKIADNSIAPSDWMGQLAQLQSRENITVVSERTGGLNGRIPNHSELQGLDQKASELGIDYGYLADGCYARGHMKCDTLSTEGVNRQKIFVEGPLTVTDGAVAADGQRTDQNWSFHTAPLVMVESERGAVEPKVWDPTLAKFRGDSMAWYAPTDWVDNFDTGGDLKVRVTDEKEFLPSRWIQGSFEKNLVEAKKDVKVHNQLAQSERFKLETIAPMMERLRQS